MKLAIKKKDIIFILIIGVLLFQDSLENITGISIINYMDELCIILVAAYAVINKRKKVDAYISKIIILVAIFWLSGIISDLINSREYTWISSLLAASFLMIKFFICVISAYLIDFKLKTLYSIIAAINFWAWVCVFTGIVNLVAFDLWQTIIPFAQNSIRFGLQSISGLFIHQGQYGWFMLFAGAMNLAFYDRTKQAKTMIKSVVFMLFGVLSFRTKVIVGVIVIYGFRFLLKNKWDKFNTKSLLIMIGALIIGLVLFYSTIAESFSRYISGSSEETARSALMSNGIQILFDYFPFGVGFGQYGSYYARINYSSYYYIYNMTGIYGLEPSNPKYATDTYWPAVFGETGIIGTIAYLYAIFLIFKRLGKTSKKVINNPDFRGTLIIFAFYILMQTLVESFGEPIFNSSPQNIFIAIVIGIALSSVNKTKTMVKLNNK